MTREEMIKIEPRLQRVVDIVQEELINDTPSNPWLVYNKCKQIINEYVGFFARDERLSSTKDYDIWVGYVGKHVYDALDRIDAEDGSEENSDEDSEEEEW
jgi:hypothetical protein